MVKMKRVRYFLSFKSYSPQHPPVAIDESCTRYALRSDLEKLIVT